MSSKIEAIKYLRQETNMGLGDAKKVVERIETLYLDGLKAPQLQEVKEAQSRAKCYQEDLHSLIRLVDYFVQHPDEYEAWKHPRGMRENRPQSDGSAGE